MNRKLQTFGIGIRCFDTTCEVISVITVSGKLEKRLRQIAERRAEKSQGSAQNAHSPGLWWKRGVEGGAYHPQRLRIDSILAVTAGRVLYLIIALIDHSVLKLKLATNRHGSDHIMVRVKIHTKLTSRKKQRIPRSFNYFKLKDPENSKRISNRIIEIPRVTTTAARRNRNRYWSDMALKLETAARLDLSSSS
ncbi:unnamed protein product [Dracunculus medinensis]|uniref:Uncharacterized protein n=1 Tax=Dracunculus medinensis TaxID=318479 RepID=A0A0N4UHH1_DRAME|nr:unnamed protein product [Dracunculus medinensis]